LGIADSYETPLKLIQTTREGIVKKTADLLADTVGLTLPELSRCLHVSARTLQRYKADDRLNPDLSDHLLQVARVYLRALDVLGDRERAALWLKQPSVALGNISPLELLDTFTGIGMVLDELTRIEYGVVS
jgi:putative toxin-antitoxin system antitoxin component (TIGR02293 family)